MDSPSAAQPLNLSQAGEPGYLGSAAVVERLLRDFFGRVLQANTEDDLHAACSWLADVFMGLDPEYRPVEGWRGMGGLSQALGERLKLDAHQFEGEVLKQAFARLATEALIIARRYRVEATAQRLLDRLIHYATALLIGVADVEYPGGLGWKLAGPQKRGS